MPNTPPHLPALLDAPDAACPAPSLSVRLLGRGHFLLGGEPLRLTYARVQALLLLLLLEPAGLARERLTDLLWPAQDTATARSKLRHALHLLRRLLGEQRLQTTRDGAVLRRLPADAVDLDGLRAPPHPGQLALLDDYQGELLAGWSLPDAPGFMAWLDRQRLATHALVVSCLERLHADARAARQVGMAVAVSRSHARVDPWSETPHRRLIQDLADAGREAEALAHWDLVRETYQRELDTQPSEGLRQLALGLQRHAVDAGPPQPSAGPRSGLPGAAGLVPDDRRPVAPDFSTEAGTLLHADCRALDPRDAAALAVIAAVHRAVEAAAEAAGGRLRRSAGTSLMLRFDGRPARGSACERALQVAVGAQEAWRAHPGGSRVVLRIGLHRGPLLAADGASLDPLGQVAGMAAAVAASGLAGDILASPAVTQRLPAHDWVLLPRRAGPYGEAGLPVLRLAAADAAGGHVERALLGRTGQKAAVLQAWRRARRGQARALLIIGAPGTGKSRLARWALQGLPGSVEPWLIDCLPSRREAPAAPLAALLTGLCRLTPGDPAVAEVGPQALAAGLQRLAPGLSDASHQALACLLGLRPDDPAWTPTQRRKELLDAFVAVLRARLDRGPLLLVLEDLHGADATTLQAAVTAVQQLATAPLLVLATTRPQEDGPLPGWTPLRTEALEPAHAQELAQQVLQQLGQAQPDPARVLDIAQRSGGNPLFVEALAMAAAQSVDGLPASLEDGLLGALAPEPAARQLARAASVLGEAFSLALLRALCSEMDDDGFHAAWRHLLRHGLVHRQGDQGRFHHALIRDAVHASLGAEQRRALHARAVQATLADRLDRGPHLAQTQSQALWLARHAEQAALLDAAAGWYEQAAQQALALAAFGEAAAHYARALALVERLPASAAHQHGVLRLALGRAHATVPWAGYGAEVTHQAFRTVLDLGAARAGSDEVFQAHYGLWLGGSSRGGYRQALLYVQRVQRHADASGDTVHRLQAAYAWGNTLLWLGELARAQQHLQQALALHAGLPPGALFPAYSEDTGVIARALLAWAVWLQGDEPAALQLQAEAIALAESLAHAYSLAFALACAARLAVMRGDAAGVALAVDRLLGLAQRHDLALWQAVGGVQQGWLMAQRGNPQGLALAASSIELAAPALPALEVTMLSMQADALYRYGDLAACAAVVQTALARCDHWDDRYMQPELLRLAALCAPGHPGADQHLARGRALAEAQGAVAWVQRIEAAQAGGRPQAA